MGWGGPGGAGDPRRARRVRFCFNCSFLLSWGLRARAKHEGHEGRGKAPYWGSDAPQQDGKLARERPPQGSTRWHQYYFFFQSGNSPSSFPEDLSRFPATEVPNPPLLVGAVTHLRLGVPEYI